MLLNYFNPRSDERSDAFPHLLTCSLLISIHAPTNGATTLLRQDCSSSLFQSTLRRTERQRISECNGHHDNFNPRSDERSDNHKQPIFKKDENFNPRSDERSDIYTLTFIPQWAYFNPRSDERSDVPFSMSPPSLIEFQSTLRRTERHFYLLSSRYSIKFQSTLRRTERLCFVYL